MPVIRAPKACGLYLPGHMPHWIQARKGWEDRIDLPVPCRLIDCGADGTILIEIAGEELRLWNHQPERLLEVVDASRGAIKYQARWHLFLVESSPGGDHVFSVAKPSDVHVPCPAAPPSGSPARLLANARGFSLPASELAAGASSRPTADIPSAVRDDESR